MKTNEPRVIHYLVGATEEYGFAHCLDLDLVATADEGIGEAVRRLDILVRCDVQIFFSAASKVKAPEEYWDRFEHGTPYGTRFLALNNPSIEVIDPPTGIQFQVEEKQAA
jgi:hypothetical protein